MTFREGTWTLQRDTPDFTSLDFGQRFIGTFGDDGVRIDGRWNGLTMAAPGNTTSS